MTLTWFVHCCRHIWRERGSAQGRRLNCKGWGSGHKGPLKTPPDRILSYTAPYCQACYHRRHGHSGNLQDRTERKERRRSRPYCFSSGSRFGQRDRRRYFEHKKTYKVYNFTFITVLSMFVGVWAEVTPYTLKRWFTLTGAVSVDAVKTLRTETWQINSDTFFCWSRIHSVFILTYLQSLYHNMGAGNLQCTAYSPAHRNHCNTAASANKMAKHLTDYSL